MVRHIKRGEWQDLVHVERAMGFPEGYTKVMKVLETHQREVLGRVMDPHSF